jgi:hypothetical protein
LNLNSINNNINSNNNNHNNFNININNNNNISSRNLNTIQQNNSRNNNASHNGQNVVEMDVMIKPEKKIDAGNPMGYNVRLYEDNLKIQRYKIVNSVSEVTSDNIGATGGGGSSNTGQCECTATTNAIVMAPTSVTGTLTSPALVANFSALPSTADYVDDKIKHGKPTDADLRQVLVDYENTIDPEAFDVALKLHDTKLNPNNVELKPNNSLDSSKLMDENTSSSLFSDGMKIQQIRYNIGNDGSEKKTQQFSMTGMAMAGSKIPIFHPPNSRIAKCASWAGVDSTNSSMSSTNPDMADLTPGE